MQTRLRILAQAGLAIVAFASTGCTFETIHLKAVDENTRQPLAGVTTEWRQDRRHVYEDRVHTDLTNRPPSGQNGMISVSGLHRTWVASFIFSCPGYANVYGYYGHDFFKGGTLTLAKQVNYYNDPYSHHPELKSGPQSSPYDAWFYVEGEKVLAVKTNGYFLVPMQR